MNQILITMPTTTTAHHLIDTHRERVLGLLDGPGPTLLVVAGVHGNEVSGLDAALRVFSTLRRRGIQPAGRLVALIGNLAAYENRLRYVDEDLNRIWLPERVTGASAEGPVSSELGEMSALLDVIQRMETSSTGPLTLLDLHTTSAASPPFVALAGNDRARAISSRMGAVEVRGITAYLKGMLVNHATQRGWTALAFEAGAHRNIDSIDIHESFIWQALEACEMVEPQDLPRAVRSRQQQLRDHEAEVGSTVDIVHHHVIQLGDQFRMRPGFRNFQPVRQGDLLAEDRHGPIKAPRDARIFMPLYQAEGQDGFFLVRETTP